MTTEIKEIKVTSGGDEFTYYGLFIDNQLVMPSDGQLATEDEYQEALSETKEDMQERVKFLLNHLAEQEFWSNAIVELPE